MLEVRVRDEAEIRSYYCLRIASEVRGFGHGVHPSVPWVRARVPVTSTCSGLRRGVGAKFRQNKEALLCTWGRKRDPPDCWKLGPSSVCQVQREGILLRKIFLFASLSVQFVRFKALLLTKRIFSHAPRSVRVFFVFFPAAVELNAVKRMKRCFSLIAPQHLVDFKQS